MSSRNKSPQSGLLYMMLIGLFSTCEGVKPQYGVQGTTVDSLSRPVAHVKLLIHELEPGTAGPFPFSGRMPQTKATHSIQTDSIGNFTQIISWAKDLQVSVGTPVNAPGYTIEKCPVSAERYACQTGLFILEGNYSKYVVKRFP